MMTIDEALNILKQYIDYDNPNVPDFYTMAEACEVVIKTLEQEPCEDCISRQAAINAAIDGADKWDGGFNREREKCIQEEIEKLPSVTPQPKMERWIEHIHNGIHYIECSKCSSWFLRMYLTRNSYCPNCGAKMQEVEE